MSEVSELEKLRPLVLWLGAIELAYHWGEQYKKLREEFQAIWDNKNFSFEEKRERSEKLAPSIEETKICYAQYMAMVTGIVPLYAWKVSYV